MSRKRLKTRKLTLCATISQEAYDRIGELADNYTDGVMSQMLEKLINEKWTYVLGIKNEEK